MSSLYTSFLEIHILQKPLGAPRAAGNWSFLYNYTFPKSSQGVAEKMWVCVYTNQVFNL